MLNIVSRHRSLRLSSSRKLPMARVVIFLCLISLALTGDALASGGTTITNAPTISFGVPYYGNTALIQDQDYQYFGYEYHEFWTVPLIAGDSLTVNFENASGSRAPGVDYVSLFKAGTTDYSYADAHNSGDYWYENISDNGHGQFIQMIPTSGVYPLDFVSACSFFSCDTMGPFDFTAYVKHAVLLHANASTLRYRGTWTVGVLHADGSPINDSSLSLKLFVKRGCCWKAVGKGIANGGKAAVKYKLPKSTRKHVVRLKLIASGSAYTATAVTKSVRIS